MKVALIGCGKIAPTHLRILKQVVPEAEVYLCDITRRQAEDLGTKWHVQGIYTSLEELLSSKKPDAIHILTPPQTHAALAEKAILADCHVLVEKPVTETTGELAKLAASAKSRKRVFAGNYSTLGMPIVQRARQQINSGDLGRLIAVHCDYSASWPGNTIHYADPVHWSYSLKGGVLRNGADHPASLAVGVLDSVDEHKTTVAHRNALPFNSPDLLHVVVKNRDQIGSFTLSLGHGNTDIRAHFLLEGGFITIDLRRMLFSLVRMKGQQKMIQRALSGILEGSSLISGTLSNILGMITKKLQREPGIFHVINNFYKAIDLKEDLLIPDRLMLTITGLLEEVWKEV